MSISHIEGQTSYRMPAEWEKHTGTIIAWPLKESLIWQENHREVVKAYAEVAKAISAYEKVLLIVTSETEFEAKALCKDKVTYKVIDHDDAWIRDNGPTFMINSLGNLLGINWQFNAWGGEKYQPYDLDDKVAKA